RRGTPHRRAGARPGAASRLWRVTMSFRRFLKRLDKLDGAGDPDAPCPCCGVERSAVRTLIVCCPARGEPPIPPYPPDKLCPRCGEYPFIRCIEWPREQCATTTPV